MKNLKKIAALVIVLALALSTVSFAFTDVAEDASYNEAVEVMADLGLLKGYEDGSFGPDKTIKHDHKLENKAVEEQTVGNTAVAAGVFRRNTNEIAENSFKRPLDLDIALTINGILAAMQHAVKIERLFHRSIRYCNVENERKQHGQEIEFIAVNRKLDCIHFPMDPRFKR